MSRIVRTYDANGRILEEKQIQENPALLFADHLVPGEQFNAAQLEALNREMKLRLSGRSGTGITYAYDAQGRVTEMRDRNAASDTVTTISYNEHGDKSEERTTIAGNATVQFGMAFSMDENGTVTPEKRTVEESPDLPLENEVLYAYEYDGYGNWTQQTQNHSYGPDSPSNVCHRKLTYY